MSTHKLLLCRNIPIAFIDGKRYVIATGERRSFIDGPSIHFDGVDWNVEVDLNRDAGDLSKEIGTSVNGILGSFFLCNFCPCLDYRNSELYLSRGPKIITGMTVNDLDANMLPRLSIQINNRTFTVLISTEFDISYFGKTEGIDLMPCLERYEDISSWGNPWLTDVVFTTAVYGNSRFNLRIGTHPNPTLLEKLRYWGVDGVVGYDFFSRFTVSYDCWNRTLTVVP